MPIRLAKQWNHTFLVYFFGYFLSDQKTISNQTSTHHFVNEEYEKIKNIDTPAEELQTIIDNFFYLLQQINNRYPVDYLLVVPQKSNNCLQYIGKKLTQMLHEQKDTSKVKLINAAGFTVQIYRKFYQFKFNTQDRKQEINQKINLEPNVWRNYQLRNKIIVLIDDVIATGVTLVTAAKLIQKYEASVTIIGLTYGSVYKWKSIYQLKHRSK